MTALSVSRECKIINPDEEIYIVKCEYSNETGENLPKLRIELSRGVDAIAENEESELPTANDSVNTQMSFHFCFTFIKLQHENKRIFESLQNSTFLNISDLDKFHFALDGHTWNMIQLHFADFIPKIVVRGTIFARFRPEQKTSIVNYLKEYDYIVAMCGDGANDCGALKVIYICKNISYSQIEFNVDFFH